MGNVFGTYDAKEKGFGPGCSSLHLPMTAHGPEAEVFEKASNADLKPTKLDNTMSFMFESTFTMKTTKFVMDDLKILDDEYYMCWSKLADHFKKEWERIVRLFIIKLNNVKYQKGTNNILYLKLFWLNKFAN